MVTGSDGVVTGGGGTGSGTETVTETLVVGIGGGGSIACAAETPPAAARTAATSRIDFGVRRLTDHTTRGAADRFRVLFLLSSAEARHGVVVVAAGFVVAFPAAVDVVGAAAVPWVGPHPFWNSSTGWSSAPFGATPS